MSTLKKIWLDTTTNPKDGKCSRKSLMMWGTYFVAIGLSIASVRIAVSIELIVVLLGFAFGITGLSVLDKYFNRSKDAQ